MTDAPRNRPAAAPSLIPPQRGTHRELLTFDAFCAYHSKLWLRYAFLQVGNRRTAARIVRAVREQLEQDWEAALRQKSVPSYAWAVLKDHLAVWLAEHDRLPVMPETAAFHAAVRKILLRELQDEFAVLESELGLYTAISRLPENQCDVIVLRYVLGADDQDVAGYLGVNEATVRSHIRYAKLRLARQMKELREEQ
ncbi:RNA polymerase sigma factor [Streptomyces sp. NBC_01476]|uniref:RNA polymerase sigma factor n=1 Tax=Streptomyces sp. NBC_01476 TaxID=2903881 RepID=UPI002E353FBC|nr:sigma factor-like helix-turn-helix DNA-binding protein [Streptomyces sp. NBC_01476]